jgi:signal transduction histidine kinase
MSHELRTPLTQVLLYAETLGRDRPLAPEQRATAVDVIVREARRLVQMVENVLALSRVARPELRVLRRPEQVDQLVREVLAGFEPMLRQRDVRAITRVPAPLEAAVDGDAVRQILINLVDNAVRHGPAGQEIVIGADRVNGVVRLTVDDTGPGIPPERRAEVWRPFVRLSNGSGSAGSGIGLAVVRQLAELHGGGARIEEAPGGGTRFVIELAVGDRGEG